MKPHGNSGKGKGFAWLHERVNYQGDDCLPWPFCVDGRVGRGLTSYSGKRYWAHRLMCELAHGPAPADKPQAAHNCGNGHEGCCNPRHLEWKTNSQNQIDRQHGRAPSGNPYGNRGRFTPEQIATMRALRPAKTQMQIAEQFGCALGTVQYYLKYREQRGHEPVF